jgi:cyclase
MVLSIEAKRTGERKWEAYCDNGREKTGVDVVEWAREGCRLGAGEILLTSVDREGTRKGFDCELVREVSTIVPIPVIASGGMGSFSDFAEVVGSGHADAVAVASVFHYGEITVMDLRREAILRGIKVRIVEAWKSQG